MMRLDIAMPQDTQQDLVAAAASGGAAIDGQQDVLLEASDLQEPAAAAAAADQQDLAAAAADNEQNVADGTVSLLQPAHPRTTLPGTSMRPTLPLAGRAAHISAAAAAAHVPHFLQHAAALAAPRLLDDAAQVEARVRQFLQRAPPQAVSQPLDDAEHVAAAGDGNIAAAQLNRDAAAAPSEPSAAGELSDGAGGAAARIAARQPGDSLPVTPGIGANDDDDAPAAEEQEASEGETVDDIWDFIVNREWYDTADAAAAARADAFANPTPADLAPQFNAAASSRQEAAAGDAAEEGDEATGQQGGEGDAGDEAAADPLFCVSEWPSY